MFKNVVKENPEKMQDKLGFCQVRLHAKITEAEKISR